MVFVETRDRGLIERFLRRNTAAHLYALADLDELFWPETTWYALEESGEYTAVALMLGKLSQPIVYAVSPPDDPAMRELLAWLRPRLPDRFFYNLGVGLADVFRADHVEQSAGTFWKMKLTNRDKRLVIYSTGGDGDDDGGQVVSIEGEKRPRDRGFRLFAGRSRGLVLVETPTEDAGQ